MFKNTLQFLFLLQFPQKKSSSYHIYYAAMNNVKVVNQQVKWHSQGV